MTPETETNMLVDIEGLKKDITIVNKVWEKLDKTMDKLLELVSNLSAGLMLHDQKFGFQELKDKSLEDDIRFLTSKIESLSTRVEAADSKLNSVLEQLQEVNKSLAENKKEDTVHDKSIFGKLSKIQIWVYMAVGAFALLTWELSHLDLVKFFSFFQQQTIPMGTVGLNIPLDSSTK
jgi:chromosome segregation ATPase